jgi:hypothetical protein
VEEIDMAHGARPAEHGDDATLIAARRSDALLAQGDAVGYSISKPDP